LIYVLNLIDPPNLNNTTRIPKPTADSEAVNHSKKLPNKYPFRSYKTLETITRNIIAEIFTISIENIVNSKLFQLINIPDKPINIRSKKVNTNCDAISNENTLFRNKKFINSNLINIILYL
jgi:hypothetical protein